MSTGPTLRGFGTSPGIARGPALVIQRDDDLHEVPQGCIVIARIVHPHLAPLFLRIGGVVVEEGAILQHATTLARELSVPAVVDCRGATQAFQTGDWVEVDGAEGTIASAPQP